MGRRSKSFAMVGLLLATGCAAAGTASVPGPDVAGAAGATLPQRVIVLLVDGGGLAQWTSALHAAGSLAVQEMPVVGLVDTRSGTHRVTDSAAGATAYATGHRTFQRAVGVGLECREIARRDTAAVRRDPTSCAPLRTVLEAARDRGMATGIVTTAAVVDASPAAFVAKSPTRYWYDQIADQFVAARLDVLLGGGRGYFQGGARADGRDVTEALCEGALCITTAAELQAYTPDDRRLVGLFTGEAMPMSHLRSPSLPLMVETALRRLERNPAGFFAFFESESTDDAGHENIPLAEMAREMIDFDSAVRVALDYARRTPGTLVLVLADHETGGMSILERADSVWANYATGGHSGTMVPLFAYGPGAERFGGIRGNDEVGRILMELVEGR
jgi:alkaline phosphatase